MKKVKKKSGSVKSKKTKSRSKKTVTKRNSKPVSKIKLSKSDKRLLKLKQYFKVDLRRYRSNPELKRFILSLRGGYKANHFKKRFSQYLLKSINMYYDLYSISTQKLYNGKGVSNYILNKISRGELISNKSYKKFMAATELILTSTEKSFLWSMITHLKRYGRISRKRIRTIINELIRFHTDNEDLETDFGLYDLLRLSYA